MDLYKLIQDLTAEKEKLERVIASLKALQVTADRDIPSGPENGKRRASKSVIPPKTP